MQRMNQFELRSLFVIVVQFFYCICWLFVQLLESNLIKLKHCIFMQIIRKFEKKNYSNLYFFSKFFSPHLVVFNSVKAYNEVKEVE